MSDSALPAGWSLASIDSLGRISGGGTPNTSDNRYWHGGTIPWVSPKDMKSLEIVDAQDHITPLAVEESSTKLVQRGAVLLVIRSGILQHTLPVGITGREVALNQDMKAIQPPEGIEPRFLAYGLLANQTRILNECCKTGTTVQSIEIPQFRRFQLPLAPTAEQTRIADRIDELLTDLAVATAALDRVKRNLSRYRAAVLHAAVTGRLTEAWRKQHGPPDEPGPELLERILSERRMQWECRTLAKYERDGKQPPKNWRDRYREPAPPRLTVEGTESVLPVLPKSWCWASLHQISDVTGGVAKNQKEAGGSGMRDVPYLRVANVQRGYLDLAEVKTISATAADIDELTLQPDDVLFTEGGDRDKLGRGWVWEGQIQGCIHQNHIFRARLYLPEIRSVLLSHAGNSYGQVWFRSNGIQSVNLASISLGVLRQFPIPIAPIAEQTAIVEAVNEKLSQIDALEAEVERGLTRASRLRQSILKSAFEGRLVVQDPTDEPASLLLERIKQHASEHGDRKAAKRTVQRRRGRPPGSRKATAEASEVVGMAEPAAAKRTRKAKAR